MRSFLCMKCAFRRMKCPADMKCASHMKCPSGIMERASLHAVQRAVLHFGEAKTSFARSANFMRTLDFFFLPLYSCNSGALFPPTGVEHPKALE